MEHGGNIPIKKLLKILSEKKEKRLGFYIDMGNEFSIYEGPGENPTRSIYYNESLIDFVNQLMEHFGVEDDTTYKG